MSPLKVLLIEDSIAEACLLQEIVQELSLGLQITHLTEEGDYIDKLKSGDYDLVLLDLNLAGFSGFDVLDKIRGHPDHDITPVIILSSSRDSDDIYQAYKKHANCYLQKPSSLESLRKLVTSLVDFWVGKAQLPRGG